MARKETCIPGLLKLGIEYNDAFTLRRIAMTLHRWFELECGNNNEWSSWSITRGRINGSEFVYDDDGAPYMERHYHRGVPGSSSSTHYERMPDREKGARKRLDALMQRYPELVAYVQTDPRGASLYIIKASDVAGRKLDECYNRGVAVYK